MILTYNGMVRITDNHHYDPVIVKRCIILAQRTNTERFRTAAKLELFKILSDVVVKNIENFFSLTRNLSNILHTKDDLVGEAYLVLDKCVGNFDIKRNKQFYFYYNKSLTRAFVRVIEQCYFKHRNTDRVLEDFESIVFVSNVSNAWDLVSFYLDLYKLTDEEKAIVKSKLQDQKPKDFLSDNDDFDLEKYLHTIECIKVKIEPIRKEECYEN